MGQPIPAASPRRQDDFTPPRNISITLHARIAAATSAAARWKGTAANAFHQAGRVAAHDGANHAASFREGATVLRGLADHITASPEQADAYQAAAASRLFAIAGRPPLRSRTATAAAHHRKGAAHHHRTHHGRHRGPYAQTGISEQRLHFDNRRFLPDGTPNPMFYPGPALRDVIKAQHMRHARFVMLDWKDGRHSHDAWLKQVRRAGLHPLLVLGDCWGGRGPRTASDLRAYARHVRAWISDPSNKDGHQWAAFNEPDIASKHIPPELAAKYWVIATKVMQSVPGHQHDVMAAGEFAHVRPQSVGRHGYVTRYFAAIHAHHGSAPAVPPVVSFHDYKDLTRGNSNVAHRFLAHTPQHSKVWMTEGGVLLNASAGGGDGAENFPHTPAGLAQARQAQIHGAQEFERLTHLDPRLQRVYYYSGGGADFDSGLTGPSGLGDQNGVGLRPVYDVLTHHPVPANLPQTTLESYTQYEHDRNDQIAQWQQAHPGQTPPPGKFPPAAEMSAWDRG